MEKKQSNERKRRIRELEQQLPKQSYSWLLKDWRVWTLGTLLLVIIVGSVISASSSTTISKNKNIPSIGVQKQKVEMQSAANTTSLVEQTAQTLNTNLSNLIPEWMELMVFIFVAGFTIQIILSIQRAFR